MKKHFLPIFVLFFLSLLALPVWASGTVLVLSLEQKQYAGEIAQRKGVVEALKTPLTDVQTETLYLDDKGENATILSKVKTHKGPVVLLSGHTFGPAVFKEICQKLTPEERKKVLTVLTGHQVWQGWDALSSTNVDIVALPTHVFIESPGKAKNFRQGSDQSDKPLLVQTVGVSHGLSPEKIKEIFDKNQKNSAQPWRTDKKALLVVLGGDVQKADGTWACYTPQEAERLAALVGKVTVEQKIDYVIVTNGPRTGKIDESGKVTTVPCHTLDPVTAAFTQALSKQGIAYTLKDFTFGESSEFQTLLGLVSQTQGVTLIPGESTSMISESIDALPPGSVMVFKHNAMQTVHGHHVDSERAAGRTTVWQFNEKGWQEDRYSQHRRRSSTPKNAAQTIAEAIRSALSKLR